MTTVYVSQILLWLVVVGLSLVCLALIRQVGLLHERLAPAGALAMNQKIRAGDTVADVPVTALDGTSYMFGKNKNGKSDLLFFMSPDCPVCKTLLPTIRSFEAKEHNWLDITLASDGAEKAHMELVKAEKLDPARYVLSEQLGRAFGVSKLPYAVLIDETGKVASLGLVNSREHLESLVEAKERGVASIQDFMKRKAMEQQG
ncbi:redoxin family protein [Kordiimonas pumila]|uniref:Redoxin family protein n=1 Tax=Kordiimonas pumila TaxID=2161677 RepID=A0ABV7D4L4_9PROT|nr:redoxin family protein [Kordiimonas pumila]